jgi:hypothetical protein
MRASGAQLVVSVANSAGMGQIDFVSNNVYPDPSLHFLNVFDFPTS